MKTVLVVDDTKLVRSILARKLDPYASEFHVLTAENGKAALQQVQTTKIDLVITDIQMPVMDGFELLAHLSNNHPEIPVFVMTANGSPEVEERIDAMGSLKYFEKPINIDILIETIREIFETSARGEVNGISLPSFLQLVNMENKTCTLRVKSKGKVGQLYCLQGELIASETGGLSAEEATIEMITWDSAVIEILKFNQQKPKEIKQPLMNILMEGARRKDEQETVKKTPPPSSQPDPGIKHPEKKEDTSEKKESSDDLSSLYQWE